MNSTQTDTQNPDSTESGTPDGTDQDAAPARPISTWRRHYLTAGLWLGVLNQTEWWIPRGAWPAYATASVTRWLEVSARFDVDGAVRVADMDVSWRQSVSSFMWRKSKGIAWGITLGSLLGGRGGGPYEPADPFVGDTRFEALARDEEKRRAWFDQLPLIEELRGSIVADRDARLSRPVLLEPAVRAPHPSGLILDIHA